jgi:hypothetical protein
MDDLTPTRRPDRRASAARYAARVPASRRAALCLLVAVALVVAVAPSGQAAKRSSSKKSSSLTRSSLLWATINVCDTSKHPDTIGIRASMPGSGRKKERMYMRFEVQYFEPVENRWKDVGPSADSGFLSVGAATYRRRESGRDFAISAPAAGQAYQLRGLVTFEWRRGRKIVARTSRTTRSGHKGTTGSDPAGYSATDCTITS